MTRPGPRVAWIAAGLIATALAFANTPAEVSAADAPSEAGWTSLFDGKTLSGWEALELPKQKPSKWEVVDGLLVGTGGASMLYSPKGDYKNFKFRAELKINDKGNSGMYFRSPKVNAFTGGYEVQVNSTHTDPIRTGSLYTFVHLFSSSNPPKPNTFFTQEVEVKDVNFRGKVVTQVTVKVDGKILYTTNDFARTSKVGHFAFQQHDPGSTVSIRKVEVMELPATKE